MAANQGLTQARVQMDARRIAPTTPSRRSSLQVEQRPLGEEWETMWLLFQECCGWHIS